MLLYFINLCRARYPTSIRKCLNSTVVQVRSSEHKCTILTTSDIIFLQNFTREIKKEAPVKQFEQAMKKNRQKYENQVKAGEILSNEEKEKRREAYNALTKCVPFINLTLENVEKLSFPFPFTAIVFIHVINQMH